MHSSFCCCFYLCIEGLPTYTFENLCVQDTSIKLNDKAYKYFFIAQNYDKLKDVRQKNFLRLVMKNEGSDELSEKILSKVNTAKQNVLLRKKYMEYERQRTYDILLGKEQGATQKAEEDAIAFFKEGDSPEKIARCIKLPLERV